MMNSEESKNAATSFIDNSGDSLKIIKTPVIEGIKDIPVISCIGTSEKVNL